ncbi:sperm acrosome-associated protein 7-like [Delphinapterus leucas]|uniref:Sperm acrosome-associated protein 7-like n=1 Tax=Delphinapterus leucas TaxID=9749 RepID=A0A7F8K6L9_DELLE|nr:sperm acrosome-associated protein 7-like [Delphinapterus leucas]
MVANTGVAVFVLLLYCRQGAEFRLINVTTEVTKGELEERGPNRPPAQLPGRTSRPWRLKYSMDENVRGSVHLCFPSFFSTLFIKDAGLDESYQVGGPEGYRELSDISSLSLDPEDEILNNEPQIDESYQVGGPEVYHGSQLSSGLEDRSRNNGKCNLRRPFRNAVHAVSFAV